MENAQPNIAESIRSIRNRATATPSIALILGSGLGDFAETFADHLSIPTADIPHFPASTVPGHKGQLVFGRLHQQSILAFQGRVHYYECGDLEKVWFPIRIAHALGARKLIVTNAAGGINREFSAGDLMMITDHLNLTGRNAPGAPRRPGSIYDRDAIRAATLAAEHAGIQVRSGVYAGVLGPSYETAAEVEMLDRAGADAVGMSTVLETELAANLGMAVLGVSCITNKATGVGSHRLDHSEVTQVASKVRRQFALLLTSIIAGKS